MSQKTERRQHEALARETASWTSWSVHRWWTNGNMAVELSEPFTVSDMRLDYGCLCSDTDRRQHLYNLDRSCVFVDSYEHDPEIEGRLTRTLMRAGDTAAQTGAIRLTIEGDPIEAERHPGLTLYEARFQGHDEPRACVFLNARYVDAVRRQHPLIRWALVGYPVGVAAGTELLSSVVPQAIALDGKRFVGLVMPMANDASAIGIAPETVSSGGEL